MDYESEFSVKVFIDCARGFHLEQWFCFYRWFDYAGISWVCSGFLFMQCWCDFECWVFELLL